MSGTYTKINYSTRPAKATQRKMIVEMLQRLDRLTPPLGQYQYVGFGSPFFADFKLFHRHLGISRMFSIEAEVQDKARFDYNKPYRCVKLLMGKSTDVLPNLDLTKPSIVWLDYDYPIATHVLADVGIIAEQFGAGSVLMVTLDAEPGDLLDRAERFLERLEEPPQGLTDEDLGDDGIALWSRSLLTDRISEALEARNATRSQDERLMANQFLFFTYADGHLMTTLAWLFSKDMAEWSRCDLHDLPFFRATSDPYHIEVPSLTIREMHHLGRQIPRPSVSSIGRMSVPIEDVQLFADQYRWLPTFLDVEL